MKYSLLFLTLVLSLSASAQITIESTDMPKGGNNYTMSNGDPTKITVASLHQTGTNQSWNYNLSAVSPANDTAYSLSQVPIVFSFVFYSSTYADRLAQNINLAVVSITDIYSFYKVSSTVMEETGTGANIDGLPLPTLMNPKDVIYNFPMNYGNMDSCNSAFSTSIPSLGSWSEGRKRVNYIDGWGTLQTPLGVKNVLRVHSDVYDNDTITIDTPIHISLPPVPSHQVEYKWLAKEGGFPMLQVVTNVVAGNEIVSQVLFQDTIIPKPNAISSIYSDNSIALFPQPSDNNLTLSSGTDIIEAVCIYDLCGRIIKRINGSGQTFMNISTSDIPAGLYPVVLQCRNKNYSAKISVIH